MVTFNINKKNGNFLTRIDSGEVNSSAVPLNLIGEGVIDYGELIAESFVYLTENFASATIPENSILGQLWYDTSTDTLNVVVNENPLEWRQLITGDADGQVSTQSPNMLTAEKEGNLKWFSQLDQLYASDGDKWLLVGPQGQVNDKTGTVVLALGNERLLLMIANGEVIGGYSDNYINNSDLPTSIDVDVGADTLSGVDMQSIFVNGFGPGFTYAEGFKLFGTATDSDKLNGYSKQELDQIYLKVKEGGTLKEPLILDTTGALTIPVGTTGDRPDTPKEGMIRFNSFTSDYEGWTGSVWEKLNGIPNGPANTRPQIPDTGNGTLRYNTTTDDLELFNGTEWEILNATGFNTYIANNGSVSAEQTPNDQIEIFGGNNIETTILGTTLTIDFTGGVINTFEGDTGSVTGDGSTETLNIEGGTDIETSISGNTLTIDYVGTGQPKFTTFDSDNGEVSASSSDARLQIIGGTNIDTEINGNTLAIHATNLIEDPSGLQDNDGDTSITADSDPATDEDVLTFTAGDQKRLEIEASKSTFYGDWFFDSNASMNTTNADIAEKYNAAQPLESGTVVCLSKPAEIVPTTTAYDIDVFGVVSTKPAIKLNSEAGDDETHPYVALKGRVVCKVVGSVSYGQRIVSSDLEGIGQAVDKQTLAKISPLSIIGRALEDKNTDDVELIEITIE